MPQVYEDDPNNPGEQILVEYPSLNPVNLINMLDSSGNPVVYEQPSDEKIEDFVPPAEKHAKHK